MGVSRRWRDMILRCPSFWTTIKVTPRRHMSLLKAQVTRSAELPLEVEIYSWSNDRAENSRLLKAMLDVLIPSAHRWCSLIIQDGLLSNNLLTRLIYPILTHVSVRFVSSQEVPLFHSGNYPRLQHLELGLYVEQLCWFEVPLSITSLSLHLVGREVRSIFRHLSFQKLTTLFISTWDELLDLKPDNIHLPLLEKLVCKSGELLIRVIVAPKLTHLEYHSHHLQSINGNIFNPRTPRFPKVTRLVFDSVLHFIGSTNAIPSAFLAVRHLDLSHPGGADSLFAPEDGSLTIDHWPHLKSLTVRGIYEIPDFLDGLVTWLKTRQIMDMRRLLVRISFSNPTQDDLITFPCHEVRGIISTLYGALHELCRLEWVNVPLKGVQCALQDIG